MTWPEIASQIGSGRETVIMPFGSTEQHGRQLPICTDSVIGDEVGSRLADRLDAFIAPTLRFGCSDHHLAFAGTISIAEDTFQKIVVDVIKSLCRHGFKRIILLPTHGGNFTPLKKSLELCEIMEGVKILAFTDLEGLLNTAFKSSEKFGIDPFPSGAHAGEWETSLMLYLRSDQVKMGEATQGALVGIPEIKSKIASGLENLDKNGVIGDPRLGTAEAGKAYIEDLVDFFYQWVEEQEKN
jgi:creatinine amidohydrolase